LKTNKQNGLRHIAFVGNYLPRQCGIATFTSDLCEAVAANAPETECFALAMNDNPDGYAYPARVRFELFQEDQGSYLCAADFLKMHDIDLVCLQHEYGIFGGEAGSHILTFLRGLHIPVVTTLHTILPEPDPNQRYVMDELIQLSDRLVVMSERGSTYLKEIYGVPAEKIDLIPHGIPDVSFVDPNFFKDEFNVEGKQVLLTFGLLSANKGIEYVIRALPEILEKHPNVVYLVLGPTHPHIKRKQGEDYRESLITLSKELGLEKNVIFYDQFVSLEELVKFIGAADLYITPYLTPSQIVSGTLAYSVGAGKAVISTPYWYAEEILADGRGAIVPFKDSQAIAERVTHLLENEAERHAMRKRAYLYGREMIWPEVAKQYMHSFERARQGRALNPQVSVLQRPWEALSPGGLRSVQAPSDLPPINLDHLLRMTDNTGMLQHATFDIPNYAEGYTTDDNARALVLALSLEQLDGDQRHLDEELAARYLAFIQYAFNQEKGRFRNFLGFDRRWLEEVGSEDSQGRALWSLGTVLGRAPQAGLKGLAARLFSQALSTTLNLGSPRTWAFALLGIQEYLRQFSGDYAVKQAGEVLAERLMNLYQETRRPGWHWFEDSVTYNNATLPHALLLHSQLTAREDMAQVALESLEWLVAEQTSPDGHFMPVGSNGFYVRNGEKARFDQQPIEASAMVSACLAAYRASGGKQWLKEAQRAFDWFLGQNDLGQSLYDQATGGCHDGLHPDRVNQNEGAESTLAFLMALTEMHLARPASRLKRREGQGLPLEVERDYQHSLPKKVESPIASANNPTDPRMRASR
jgi:glycosyltransferase involved in cell wall biosynthesis